jgi:cytochrome c553
MKPQWFLGAVIALLMSGAAQAQTPAPALLQLCAACHGANGNAVVPGMPSLAGQPKTFLENQLVIIREGLRVIPAMQGMLDKVTDEDFVVLAKYFSEQPVKPQEGVTHEKLDAAKVARATQLSKQGLCGTCHLPNYSGRDQMPRLAGQREDFLLANMKQFRDGTTSGRDTMMMGVLRGMTDAQIADMAHYFATRVVEK